jgi:coenzyme F420-reducing hydrogenase delta subunit
MLTQMGVEKERCRLDYISAGEGGKFGRVICEMVESVRTLGPLLVELEC